MNQEFEREVVKCLDKIKKNLLEQSIINKNRRNDIYKLNETIKIQGTAIAVCALSVIVLALRMILNA